MSRYELVLLDLDDTLLDFPLTEEQALEGSFREAGLSLTPAVVAAYGRINHGLWAKVEAGTLGVGELKSLRFRMLFEKLGWDADPLAFGRLFVSWLSRGIFPLPGAVEACRRLAEGHRLLIVSNGIAEVQRARLAGSPFAALVEGLVVSEDVGFGKPDPRIFARACALAGVEDRSRVLMVGDSLASDIRGGIGFGVDTCWLNPRGLPNGSGLRPTYEIRGMEELPGLL